MTTAKKPAGKTASETGPCHLIFGTDEFEVSRRARHLADTLCPEAERAFGLEVIDGACDTVEEACTAIRRCTDALRTVGFFGAGKFVWLRDASFFYDGKPGKSEAVKKEIAGLSEEIKAGLMPGVRLLVSASQVDKRTAFYKAMEKAGTVLIFDVPDKSYKLDAHAENVLRGMLADAGLRASPEVVTMIVDRAGNQSRQLASEVEKLVLYLGDRREITSADVLDIVSPARERGYGELAEAVGKGDLKLSLKVARQLMTQKDHAVGLIIGVESRVRDLLVYRLALDRHWLRINGSQADWSSSPEAEEFLSSLDRDPRRSHPYYAGILAKQANPRSSNEWSAILRALVEAHGRMTDGSASPDVLLERVLIHIMGEMRERSH